MSEPTVLPPVEKTTKFYSQRAIAVATYLGGPLAAGLLLRQNFTNAGQVRYGTYALLGGILGSLLLIVAIFSLPESLMEKVPNTLIPAIYTGLVYLLVERLLGATLKQHKEENGEFYSGWKAAGIGLLGLAALCAAIFGYVALTPNQDFDTATYDRGMDQFAQNEEEALQLFTLLERGEQQAALSFIPEKGLPAWQRNIQLLNELDQLEGLYPELKAQNQSLREYCQLRITSYQLIQKSVQEESTTYDEQLEQINLRIDQLLERL